MVVHLNHDTHENLYSMKNNEFTEFDICVIVCGFDSEIF